jgi:ligand-binding SRPBCC domain-containing protein
MTAIFLQTIIHAPINICFDLSRSIDLHQESTRETNEKAIAGRTSGLIEKNEFVTWEATHFKVRQTMTVKITEMTGPFYFQDQMIKGPFRSMKHDHFFSEAGGKTIMTDRFYYEVPYGFAGRLFDRLFLKKHMTRFLDQRNAMIKTMAEDGTWKKFLT